MIQSSGHRLAIPAKFDGKPEEKLNNRHQADPKAGVYILHYSPIFIFIKNCHF